MSVHTGGQAFASVNLCGHVFVGISARAEACLSFWVWVPAPAEICKCVCTFVCLDVYVIVCLCKCLCLQVSVCLCERVPVGMSIHEHAVGAQERRLWVPPTMATRTAPTWYDSSFAAGGLWVWAGG